MLLGGNESQRILKRNVITDQPTKTSSERSWVPKSQIYNDVILIAREKSKNFRIRLSLIYVSFNVIVLIVLFNFLALES
jgi:hypothetical protein